jgi:hypothetical protein
MKNEIDKDFYCSGNYFYIADGRCLIDGGLCDRDCNCYRRKRPAPEQFRKECGEEWKGKTYSKCFSEFCKLEDCAYQEWTDFPEFASPRPMPDECKERLAKVCACTPWGKPDAGWRSE